jgi:hypothetical protein
VTTSLVSKSFCLCATPQLDAEDLAALAARFGGELDRSLLKAANLVITLGRWRRIYETPYLIHTEYELPLLLDGR